MDGTGCGSKAGPAQVMAESKMGYGRLLVSEKLCKGAERLKKE